MAQGRVDQICPARAARALATDLAKSGRIYWNDNVDTYSESEGAPESCVNAHIERRGLFVRRGTGP